MCTQQAAGGHIQSLLPNCLTASISTSEGVLKSRRALCEAIELAVPHFSFVVIVNDVVVWLAAAMMKILVLIDARIIVVGEA